MSRTYNIDKVLGNKEKVLTVGGYEFYADRGFFSILKEMKDKVVAGDVIFDDGSSSAWGSIIDNAQRNPYSLSRNVAKFYNISRDESYERVVNDSEPQLVLVKDERKRVYYMEFSYYGDFSLAPIDGGKRKRESCVTQLISQMNDSLIEYEGDTISRKLYEYIISFLDGNASVMQQQSDPNGEPVMERVIEKVTEVHVPVDNPLEQMPKQSITDLIAKVSVDDMVPRIKDKIIEEFGYEPQVHEVHLVEKDVTKNISQPVHEAFEDVLFPVMNNIPVYMYGPAGSGKNIICEQVAEVLGIPYYFMNSVTDEYKIAGFIDANGTFHSSEFYKAFTEGGLFFLDEIDASAPEVLVCLNMAIANGYFTFPTGAKKMHPDFRCVAAGNTLGTGADSTYVGRLQLDGATLNRFVVIPVNYDPNIELYCAEGDEQLVDFARKYRVAARNCGIPVICSYRNITYIKTLAKGLTLEKAIRFALTKELNQDDINILSNTMNMAGDLNGNKYFEAFRNVTSMV